LEHNPILDTIVIGSGFGGSVAANRLALAGQKVMILERGPWRDSVPVRSMGVERRSPYPYGMKAITHLLRNMQLGGRRLTLNKAGMYEFFSFPGLSVLAASAVGGASTAYGGLMETPRDPAYWHDWHPQLDPAGIEAYYPKIFADMGATPFTPDLPMPNSVWTHLPAGAGNSCAPAAQQPQMAMLLPPTLAQAGRAITTGTGIERRYCAFDGDSFLGSRGGAKASTDFVYLGPVLDKGATVRDLCEVSRIEPLTAGGGQGYRVCFTDLASGRQEQVQARRVVLAAGTMNSLRLLFANSRSPGGLAPMPALGRRFGANCDLMGAWMRNKGAWSSFSSTPSLGAYAVAGIDTPEFGMGGFPGLDSLPLPAFLKRRLQRWIFIYGMGADSGTATAAFERDRLHVDYDERQEPLFKDIRRAFGLLQSESGERVRALPKPFTVHQWGGACLGPDAQQGVVDHRGEVYGNPGLFITDGAALPAAVGGPPSVSIAAWAHHVADGMA
jgi:cholesterol oxidase